MSAHDKIRIKVVVHVDTGKQADTESEQRFRKASGQFGGADSLTNEKKKSK